MEINKKLPENVCCQVLSLAEFKPLIEKLKNLWTGIITPTFKNEKEEVKWVMPYLKYNVEGKDHYLIWMFLRADLKEEEIIAEIKQFLKDDEGEVNES